MMEPEDNDVGARRVRAAEFARMSTSKKLSLLAIRKAQLSSRDAFAAVDDTVTQKGAEQQPRPPAR